MLRMYLLLVPLHVDLETCDPITPPLYTWFLSGATLSLPFETLMLYQSRGVYQNMGACRKIREEIRTAHDYNSYYTAGCIL